jgi:hypothetical protein
MTGALGIITGSASTPGLFFSGDADSGIYSPGANQVAISTNGTGRLFVDASGNVGIGTASPNQPLHVVGNARFTASLLWAGSGATNSYLDGNTTSLLKLGINDRDRIKLNATEITFNDATSEFARIDGSGRLLVGTSSSSGNNYLQIQGDAGGATGTGGISLRRNVAPSGMGEGAFEGIIDFGPNDGGVGARIAAIADAQQGTNDYPSRLVFSTTADGASSPTERMRITSAGSAQFAAATTGIVSGSVSGAGTTFTTFIGQHSTASGPGTGTNSFLVYTNGDVQNTNNSYGAFSDLKLKENIVDALSQWDDIKALQVRKYNFKEGQTHTQIGLIAQEAELVSPGLVSESPDRDADGNDLGTVTKAVNYSVLYMKAVKALQEAMERIETLEAKVAALEAS